MASNDPVKGGSFYIQSKVYRAFEALEKEARGESGDKKKPEDKAKEQPVS